MTAPRLGVDLGGSKIEAALLDGGAVLLARRVPTPKDYGSVLAAVTRLCDAVENEAGLRARSLPLGIGTPGSASPHTGLLRNSNSTGLNGRALREDLERACARPVRMANDADCFTLSETRDGAAAGAACAFGVILGTGVGGGVTVGGRLLRGPNRVAGEWGHNRAPLERVTGLPSRLRGEPRPCYCGRRDCVETWLSGPGLAHTHRVLHGADLDAQALHGGDLSGDLADSVAVHARVLAACLAQVVNILDPAVIVLGGGLSNLSPLYDLVPPALAEQVFGDCCSTAVRAAVHGDSSGVRGAAWLW